MNRNNDYTERSIRWTWFLWFGLTIPLSAFLIYSTYELWPELVFMAALGAAAIIFASIYTTAHLNEIDPGIRQTARESKALMLAAMILNVGIHGMAGRSVGLEAQRRAEQEANQARQSRLAAEKADREKALLESQAKVLDRATRYSNATTYQASRAGVAPPPPPRVGLAKIAGEDAPVEIGTVTASPVERKSAWFWPGIFGFLVELIAGVWAGVRVLHARTRDDNQNGVPDWIERVYRVNPEFVRDHYPAFYRILSGARDEKDQFPREIDAPK